MNKCFYALLVTLPVLQLRAQGEVQVSALTAEPTALDCRQQSSAKVTAQVYFTGLGTNEGEMKAVSIHLGIYSSDPASSRLDITEDEKSVELHVSPALAEFEVSCSGESRPAKVTLVGTIIKAPSGAKINSDPLVTTTIVVKGSGKSGTRP